MTLVAGEAHLYVTPLLPALAPEVVARYVALLSPEERVRYEARSHPRARQEYLVGRALVRTALSRHDPTPPEAWRFVIGEHGKPELDGKPIGFNLSHTDGLVVCLVATTPDVGVDTEPLDRRARGLAIAERFFSPDEVALLQETPPAQRDRCFFELWTLKEAYIKARGLGLKLPLRRFGFDPRVSPLRITLAPELGDSPERWHFDLVQPTPRHLVALALGGGRSWQVRVTPLTP